MAKCLTITFPTGQPQGFYSRVLYFGESLYRPIVHAGLGTVCDLDASTNVIWIKLANPHHLGKIKKIVAMQLDRFHLAADAEVVVE